MSTHVKQNEDGTFRATDMTIVPNIDKDLRVAYIDDRDEIRLDPVIGWAIQTGTASNGSWFAEAEAITINSGGQEGKKSTIYNVSNGKWIAPGEVSGNGQDSLRKYLKRTRD